MHHASRFVPECGCWYCASQVEVFQTKASSSNGRAADSKSVGWGFKSLLACRRSGEEQGPLFDLPVFRHGSQA